MPRIISRDNYAAGPVPAGPPRRRHREAVPRARMIRFSLTEDEHAEVLAAARRAGRAGAAFSAEAVLAAARGTIPTADTILDGVLGESDRLDHAAEQLRRAGVNLNQAVRALNRTGHAPADLGRLAGQVSQRADRVEVLSLDLWKRVVRAIPSAPRPRRHAR